jgi:hypothetical protein
LDQVFAEIGSDNSTELLFAVSRANDDQTAAISQTGADRNPDQPYAIDALLYQLAIDVDA